MAVGQTIAVTRRHHGGPTEQANLAAMGVPRQLQRDARRNLGSYIRFMGKQNNGRIVGDFRQRRTEIVDTLPWDFAAPPRPDKSDLVAEPGKPERMIAHSQTLRVVFVDRNADGLERATGDGDALPFTLHLVVVPVVVIAEDRVHA